MKKRHYLIGILVGLLVLGLIYIQVSGIFNSGQVGNEFVEYPMGSNFAGMGQPMMDEEGNQYYSTYTVFEQEPVSLSGMAQLNTDNSYFYDAELGEIIAVHVVDQQTVRKGDPLFTYSKDNKELQYQIEDNLRTQTRLYNQRVELIEQLSELTAGYYNYQGDLLEAYWGEDGQLYYYVAETIGKAQGNGKGSSNDDSSGIIDGNGDSDDGLVDGNGIDNSGGAEAIKAQIREVNNQIEDLEIAMTRLKEQRDGSVLAKFAGKVYLNSAGKDNASVPFVRIVSDEVSVTGTVTEYEFFALGDDVPVNIFVNAENRDVSGTMIAHDLFPISSGSTDGENSTSMGMGGYSTGSQYGFTIKPDEYIQPGFSVKIQVYLSGVSVPQEAIMDNGSGDYAVMVYRDGFAHKQSVRLKQQGLQRVVTSGLNAGDIVLQQPYEVEDGQAIQIDQEYYQSMMEQEMIEGANNGVK
ncbi:efflux RND transporter periplasmic adaptor subunit [Fundicoccus sp. Sow4_H7]|uniref:efflux RND transporter periplasmic adaptor subunit n=1 Tax=Fundicoccus sp. Sow4_H7 TaxID=3438784 RepID=UPI003F8E1657